MCTLGLRPPISAALAGRGRDVDLPRAKEAPDFAKPTSRLAFWRHTPQHEGRHSVATAAWAILCTPFGRKVASLLASDGGIDYRWGLGGLRSLAADAVNRPHFT